MKSMLSIFAIITTICTACADKIIDNVGIDPPINDGAKIISVTVNGDASEYTFSVGIESPDTGCDQYANWWEIITTDGQLIYRRILGHSHVDEQPFIRSGGIVSISREQTVLIRAHMNNTGYGQVAYKGSVSGGFSRFIIDKNFANDLENQEPQPGDCPF